MLLPRFCKRRGTLFKSRSFKRSETLLQISLLYFRHGESTSTATQKSKDLNKVSLLLQDLGPTNMNIFFKLSSFQDVSNFDQFPRDIGVPADETSGWDADF